MRLYLIYILVKDFSLCLIFISVQKIEWLYSSIDYSVHLGWSDVIITSLYATVSVTIWDLIIQTIIYFGLRKRIRIFETGNKFLIGVLLHIPILLLFSIAIDFSDSRMTNILAITFSTIISGTVYYLLNRGQGSKLKKKTV